MLKPLSITAICGWAVPPIWFGELIQKQLPNSKVHTIYPQNPNDNHEASSILNEVSSDFLIGYSLGSLWILRHRNFIPSQLKIALLAPVLAFPKEKNLGGRISQTQLKYLIKILSRNPDDLSFLLDFYRVSGFEPPSSLLEEFSNRNVLIRGLEFLNTVQAQLEFDDDFIAIVGENDTLLDAVMLKKLIPALIVLPDAGHAPEPLLEALSKQINQ